MEDEDYKKKYEDALNRAKYYKGLKAEMGMVFPELKNEDEEIKEDLIQWINEFPDIIWRGHYTKDVDAWLKKQGEQKPSTNYLLSWNEIDEKMFQSLEGIVKDYWTKAEQEKNEIKIREASNVSYFLKTIQKLPLCWIKCSDGLPNRDGTYLVITDGRYNDVYDIARYDSTTGWHKASKIIYWMPIPQLNNKSVIEHKSAEWIEDYWQHHKILNPDSYNKDEEIQFDHDGFVRFCKQFQNPAK